MKRKPLFWGIYTSLRWNRFWAQFSWRFWTTAVLEVRLQWRVDAHWREVLTKAVSDGRNRNDIERPFCILNVFFWQLLILLILIVKNRVRVFANELSNGKINGVAFLDDLHLPPTVLLMPCNWAFSLKTFCRTCKQIPI